MPLNKLENFIKNAEGRILYVNPNDLDSTDGIENQGNSLTKPFKTIQRALIESARFSYLRGDDNDLVEKTTILVFPGEHLIDNRPGYAIKDAAGNAIAVAPGGAESAAQAELTLTLNSNFDLTQEDNILYKFNSINGGIIIPRGTSIVGLDLRKTKVRPKYVPNPTDPNAPNSAIFRVTGACYFWQFTFFDGDETGLVYTDPRDFSSNNRSKPTFSHHKLTCFEYADGVNIPGGYQLTDLDMYYSKISNAFNRASGREIDQKFPASPESFAKQRPEWEIVGAFATDPITISSIISGDGATPGTVVTVTTQTPHNLNTGTPIKIKGINVEDYNISTKVSQVLSETRFTYALPFVRSNLPAGPGAGLAPSNGASVVIETDTVTGASPYIFNVSLRSVYGMAGMHADGSKADGFRSMVVAQFTAVSLQKDDRAFVKYYPSNRRYSGISYTKVTGERLSSESSSTNEETVFHLDSDAVYRDGWKTTHIKMSNDSVIQIVSVFAIGFHKHFECLSGGDASITNSNSNFGQFSLAADGFKADSFDKDDKGYVTGVVTPKSTDSSEVDIEWVQFDIEKTNSVGDSNRLYLLGYTQIDIQPPIISQGYRIGAKEGDTVYIEDGNNEYNAKILMTNVIPESTSSNTVSGTDTSAKVYNGVQITTPLTDTTGTQTIYNTVNNHNLRNGESIRVFSETGDLPEGLEENKVYYVVTSSKNSTRTDGISLSASQFQIASSKTNATAATPIFITSYQGDQLRVESRVSDKIAGEIGHPIQYDYVQGNWFVYVESGSTLYSYFQTLTVDESEISFVRRVEDGRSIDEKIYKLRYVIPKELNNSRDPVSGFILQDSSSVNVRENSDFNLTEITTSDYDFDRNPRFISSCTYSNPTNTITITSDRTHNLKVNDTVIIKNVTSSSNQSGRENFGYNGSFLVSNIVDDKTFDVPDVDIFEITHTPGSGSFNSNVRDKTLPTFRRSDSQENIYIYRVEVVKPYIKDIQDGVYYLYILNSNNGVAQADGEFASSKYSQNITDLYPQLDRDNSDDNPPAAVSFAKRTPLGEVVTNDLKRSITRETVDKFFKTYSYGNEVISVSNSNTSATLTFDFEHQLAGITSFTTLNGGSGHTDGSYYNVKLFNNASAPSSAVWDGATADITVSGGAVTSVKIVENGSGYTNGEALYFNSDQIGGTPQANIQISTADISVATNDYVQVTGIGTTGGGYYKITNTNNKKQIGIAKTAGDPVVSVGEYVTVLGRVGQFTYSSGSLGSDEQGTFVFTTTSPTGLVAGNSVRLLDASNNNLGDYLITSTSKGSTHTVSIFARRDISTATQFLKHGLSANNASADNLGENIGTRTLSFYDNNTLVTNQSINVSTSQFKVTLPGGSTTTEKIESRFPVGSYIQIDNEIMRVSSSSLTGTNTDEIQVIRGSMGTIIESHETNSLVKKIKLSPIEFRRPSILRASGHTFEYLGYGPGNYSTGLPQVQLKTLTEDEEFLSQSQETACGTVLYTGMDSDGDFYIGNTKYSAQSGEQKTFDVPTPTITGEDPNRLSVVFDEIIVKERILVEGGKSKQILSQFDGPVTFTNNVRFNKTLSLNGVPQSLRTSGTVDIKSDADASSCTDQNAALRVFGGVSIGKRLWVCGDTDLGGTLSVDGTATFGDSSASTQLVGGIQPIVDADPGNGSGVPLGSITKAFAEAHIGRIMIGHFDGTINTGNQFITTRFGTLKLSGEKGAREVEVFSNMIVWDETASQTRYDGSFVARGGVGIVKNAIIGENLNVGGDCFLGGSVSLRGNTSINGTLSATGNTTLGGTLSVSGNTTLGGTLAVTNGASIGGNLTVNGNGNFGSNTVTAGRFAGTADQSNAVLVGRAMDAGGDDHPMLVVADPTPNGTYSQIYRDNNIRFRESSATLIVDGDIIAFASDDRLKTNKVGISNALDKVNSLSGFTYNWNEFACEQGNAFHADKKQVGVSAQEVQKVLPEAVEPAPFNEDYLTVKYDKIVPLLIEAIKELSDKVSALEDKLNN